MIYDISNDKRKIIKPLFEGIEEPMINACIEGRYATAVFADDEAQPKCAKMTVGGKNEGEGGFSIVAGDADCADAENIAKAWSKDFHGEEIIVPQNEKWQKIIERVYGRSAAKVTRYSLSKKEHYFDRQKLAEMSERVPEGYTVKLMDEEDYRRCAENQWAGDNIANFSSCESFLKDGVGVCVLYGDELACAATPFCAWNGGIEIEIDTNESHRRKGLARACGAGLVLECLKRGIYPSWDAANKTSLSIAQDLGYVPTGEYTAYFIASPGNPPARKKKLSVSFGGEELCAVLTENGGSRLCVLFPGMGYTCDRPLLHFTGKAALSLGYDLLALSYGDVPQELDRARSEENVKRVIEKCTALLSAADTEKYSETVYVGKSLGTMPASVLGKGSRQIWFTPVAETFRNFDEENTLVFTGDRDPLLGLDALRTLGHISKNCVNIVPETGHSLDTPDAIESIDILRAVTEKVSGFLSRE